MELHSCKASRCIQINTWMDAFPAVTYHKNRGTSCIILGMHLAGDRSRKIITQTVSRCVSRQGETQHASKSKNPPFISTPFSHWKGSYIIDKASLYITELFARSRVTPKPVRRSHTTDPVGFVLASMIRIGSEVMWLGIPATCSD